MTHPHRTPRSLVLALSLAVVLLGLTTPLASAATPPGRAGPMVGAPSVGDCFDLTYRQALRNSTTEKAVDCSRQHTLVVTAVGRLPKGLTWRTPDEKLYRVWHRVCTRGEDRLIGKNQRLIYQTSYEGFAFEPTAAQKKAGARWLRCDIGMYKGKGLGPLPQGTLPKAKAPLPDSIARCISAQNRFTPCENTHTYRSSYVFAVRGEPTSKRAARAAVKRCPAQVASNRWRHTHQDIWGPTFLVACYSKTRT